MGMCFCSVSAPSRQEQARGRPVACECAISSHCVLYGGVLQMVTATGCRGKAGAVARRRSGSPRAQGHPAAALAAGAIVLLGGNCHVSFTARGVGKRVIREMIR